MTQVPSRGDARGIASARRYSSEYKNPRQQGPLLNAPETGTTSLLDKLRRATIGRYDIYAELGSGGMATVFLALDLALDRKVAIKVMSPALTATPGAIERFRREARTAAALSHPHIVPIFAIGEEPGIAYYVMKYIEGRGLDSVLREDGAQSPAFVQAILSKVGTALQYAHDNGVVHRDVKPANIMLDRDGWTYVTDFGIAKREDGHGLTQSGMIIGTPAYMCPEQFNGAPVTGAADQYALGVVAYEMLAGRTPYDGPSLGEVMRGHLLEPVPPVRLARPDVPEELEACVTRMLAKEPGDRFPSLTDAVAAIGTFTATAESEARTSIIKLARASDATRPRISVPQSPTPGIAQRAPDLTVRTPASAERPAFRKITLPEIAEPEPEPSRGGSTLFRLFVLLVVVAGLGYGIKRFADRELARTRTASTTASTTVPAAAANVAAETPPQGPPQGPPQVPGGGEPGSVASAGQSPVAATLPAPDSAAGRAPPQSAAAPVEAAGTPPSTPPAVPTEATLPNERAGGARASEDEGARRNQGQGRALRERLDALNDRREAAGQAPIVAGLIRIGTTGPRYTVFVNGRARQVVNGRGLHDVPVPAGSVTLSLRAMNCISWDTVLTVRSSQVHVIGERAPAC
ncbi:MAG: protein kinase [Gemmatimonadetes bacterium]|nr:protein kinase [Gemmatimonadota bacterium]